MKKILVAQGGGPTAVINQSLVGVIKAAKTCFGVNSVFGAIHGIRGIVDNNIIDLSLYSDQELERVANSPGSALGSTRDKPDTQYCQDMFKVMVSHDINYFLYIGGNDSVNTVGIVEQVAKDVNYDLTCIHIPKTIDNDLVVSDHTPGFGSAALYVARSFMGLDMDNRSLPGVYLAVIMGRDSGFLTASAALARSRQDDGPHLIYLPETVFDIDNFINDVKSVYEKYGRCVIAISEGIVNKDKVQIATLLSTIQEKDAHGNLYVSGGDLASMLVKIIKDKLKYKRVRGDTFGYNQRSFYGCVSSVDKTEARIVGEKAVIFANQYNKSGSVTIHRYGDYVVDYQLTPLNKMTNEIKTMSSHFINDNANNITKQFIDYAKPLVGGLEFPTKLYFH